MYDEGSDPATFNVDGGVDDYVAVQVYV